MFQKVVHPYEDIDGWEKSKETLLSETEDFYSHLHMKDITDADYTHAERVCKDFKRKFGMLSLLSCSKQHTIVSWCIWGLPE